MSNIPWLSAFFTTFITSFADSDRRSLGFRLQSGDAQDCGLLRGRGTRGQALHPVQHQGQPRLRGLRVGAGLGGKGRPRHSPCRLLTFTLYMLCAPLPGGIFVCRRKCQSAGKNTLHSVIIDSLSSFLRRQQAMTQT